jgi:glutathione reductase (NADPH)
MPQVDLFVIGGGSGGVRAARVAAQHGARVALAESSRVGGTCVIRGCVPKKLMVLASRFSEGFRDSARYGFTVGDTAFHWPTLAANVHAEVARLEAIYTANLQRAGVTLRQDRAVIEAPGRVRLVGSDEVWEARHILIATGAHPNAGDPWPGHELADSSDAFFDWPTQPRRVLVIGAGYVALELATVLRRLGSSVTVVLRGERVLRGFDEALREHLQAALVEQGLELHPGCQVTRLERRGDGAVDAELSDGHRLVVDAVLRATGRDPNTQGLGLDAIGVQIDARGAVRVDDWSATSVAGIHAVGDVTDRVALTPAAIREGQAYADTVFGNRPTPVRHGLVPTAVFTTPEVGTVGLTEAEAAATHAEVDVYETRFRPMAHVMAGRPDTPAARSLMKLLVDAGSDRVLGVHLLGPDAGEMIQLMGVALQAGATKATLDATLPVHPTAAEELVTLRTPTRRIQR